MAEHDVNVQAVGGEAIVEHAEEPIHMPAPSFSPIVLALGLAILVYGLIGGAAVLIVGAVVTVIGLGTWILDDIRGASAHES